MAEGFVQLPAVEVRYQGRPVAAVAIDPVQQVPVFEYFPEWLAGPEDLAPLALPTVAGVQLFPDLVRSSFRGVPGLVADSLPGQFADLLTNSWLARHGVQPGQVTVVDRLGYVGDRGFGALTFHPSFRDDLEVPSVVDLSEAATTARTAIEGTLGGESGQEALRHLLDTSGSAGGARAKAALAIGPGGELRSGQRDAPPGFEHWLLKFDVARDQRGGETTGLGLVELAYHLMATDAGLTVSESRILEVDGLFHFLTRRFDRPGPADRVHVQSLAAIAHLPPELSGAHGYEQFLQTCLRLDLGAPDRRQAFRQVVFNVAAAVRDDHTKNLAFLYDEDGWRLAPAFDLTFPYLEGGGWLTVHQMSIAGRVDGTTRQELRDLAERARVPGADDVIDEVLRAVRRWPEHAATAGVLPHHEATIGGELDVIARALSG